MFLNGQVERLYAGEGYTIYLPTAEPVQRSPLIPANDTETAPAISWPPYDEKAEWIPVQSIRVLAEQFQFKSGSDKDGVNGHLHNVSVWEAAFSGLSIVWRDLKGDNYAADGHQRRGRGQQLRTSRQGKEIGLNAIVLEEAQGWSMKQAKLFAAYKNIAEDGVTTKPVDVALLLRDAADANMDPELLATWLPVKNRALHDGKWLARLGDEAFDLVVKAGAKVPWGVYIAQKYQDEELQKLLLESLLRAKPKSMPEAADIIEHAIEAGFVSVTQHSLFGSTEMKETLIPERIRIAHEAEALIRRRRAALNTVKGDQTVSHSVDATFGIKAHCLSGDLPVMHLLLQRQANQHGEISTALTACARRLKQNSASIGEAVNDFIVTLHDQARALRAAEPEEGLLQPARPEADLSPDGPGLF